MTLQFQKKVFGGTKRAEGYIGTHGKLER